MPHLTTDEHGHSVLGEVELKLLAPGGVAAGPAAGDNVYFQRLQAASQPVKYWQVGEALPGHFVDFTPTSEPTVIAVFSGQMSIVASNGEERQLSRGDMLLAEDLTGQGHMTRFLGQEPCRYLLIVLPATGFR